MPRKFLLKLTEATTFSLGLLLALTITLSPGCITPQPTPETTPNPTVTIVPDELLYSPSNLLTHTPIATTPLYDIPHGRLLAYQGHFGEFGGILYEGGDLRGTMHIYITEGNFDPALIPGARERFDRIYRHRPNQKIVVHKAQYPWSRLEEWKSAITQARAGDNTLGIYSWGVSQRDRLIFLDATPKRGNRERIEAILATTGVPRDAVQVNIGCGDYIPPNHTTENIPPGFGNTFAYSVEAPVQVQYGETVDLKLVVQNLTLASAYIYGGTNSVDFVVTNEAGKLVWYWGCSQGIRKDILLGQNVSPDKPLELAGRWEQIDTRGYPVPPGVYLVKGVLDMDYPEKLVTTPISIEILPP